MRSFPRPEINKAQALAALKTELATIDEDRLFGMTVDRLRARYKVSEREIECILLASQASRRRFLASGEVGA